MILNNDINGLIMDISDPIGPFRVGKTIGKGGFSEVKVATHELTKQKVAVKFLNQPQIKEQKLESQVQHEIEILRQCRHPHILRLYQVVETPESTALVTMYMQGGELFDYLSQQTSPKWPKNEARFLCQQIASAVQYLHSHQIAHRDLKLENLLLDATQTFLTIIDFGLSKPIQDKNALLTTMCGSPYYAAAEILAGTPYHGLPVDVWSCGVLFYTLLCGTHPFLLPRRRRIPTTLSPTKSNNKFSMEPIHVLSTYCRMNKSF